MAIEALVGNSALLWVNTGTEGSPNYQAIGLQRGLSDETTREMIDASHKGSDFTKNVYGRQSGTLSLEALEPDPDFGGAADTHSALKSAMDNKQPIGVQLKKTGTEGTIITYEAECLVGTMSTEYPDNDVSVISLELTMQEPWNEV